MTCRQSPHLQLRAGSLDKASNCARDIGGSSETEDSSTAQKHARKVVIVEGLSDRAAVQRAVRHTVSSGRGAMIMTSVSTEDYESGVLILEPVSLLVEMQQFYLT